MLGIQKIIRRFYFRRKKQIFKEFHSWMNDQSLSLEELQKKQLKKLNRLIHHAYNNVPYYKDVLDVFPAGKNSKLELKALSEIERFPFLTKEIINKQNDRLYSYDHITRKSFKNSSGGSTGVPTEILQDERYLISNEACLLQLKNWRGVDPFDSEIIIWGAERDTFEGKKPFSSYLKDFLRNRMILNCFRMTEVDIEKYIKLINKHKPKLIRSYVDAVYEIARYAKKKNIKIEPQHAVHTGAGNLFDYMRNEIESAFGCNVFNQYGGREVGSISSECSVHDGMHIQMEHNVVEVLKSDGSPALPDEEGEIVITNLSNYSMPLIRYKIGDMGTMKKYSECRCGCNYPKLSEITGRVGDVFVNKEGRTISPVFFAHLIGVVCNNGSIAKYQVIQKDYNHLMIKIVRTNIVQESVLNEIRDKIKDVMGSDIEVVYKFVDEIDKNQTGKYRYTICEINN